MLIVLAQTAAPANLLVNTTLGPVEGKRTDGVNLWRGLPFAAPPTGANRFRPPQPAVPWSEPRPSTREGHQCPQLDGIDRPGLIGDEDCLYLHVAAPAHCTPGVARCPVMFWLFGGAFVLGSANEFGWYDPKQLARTQDAVVVATNYRLGPLGFLALPALQRESNGSVGNWGMLDQRQALEWTRDNIARFGGDPDAVTLFGESAGAMSVCWHLAADASRGLFSRAILESGLCDFPAFFQPLDSALDFGSNVTAAAGCDAAALGTDAAMLACVRALPPHAWWASGGGGGGATSVAQAARVVGAAARATAATVEGASTGDGGDGDGDGDGWVARVAQQLRAQGIWQRRPALATPAAVPPLSPLMDWGPVVDGAGGALAEVPLRAIEAGRGSAVPTVVGTNNDEGSLFLLMVPSIVPGTSLPPKAGDVRRVVMHVFGGAWGNASAERAAAIADAVEREYSAADYNGSDFWRLAAILRDYIFACPTRRLARALDARGVAVWRYHFAPRYCAEPSALGVGWEDLKLLRCYHTSELFAVWGHAWPELGPLRHLTPEMRGVANTVQTFWGELARSADPNGNGTAATGTTAAAAWPRYHRRAANHSAGAAADRLGDNATELTLMLAEELAVERDYLADRCDFWDAQCGRDDCFGPAGD